MFPFPSPPSHHPSAHSDSHHTTVHVHGPCIHRCIILRWLRKNEWRKMKERYLQISTFICRWPIDFHQTPIVCKSLLSDLGWLVHGLWLEGTRFLNQLPQMVPEKPSQEWPAVVKDQEWPDSSPHYTPPQWTGWELSSPKTAAALVTDQQLSHLPSLETSSQGALRVFWRTLGYLVRDVIF